MLKYLRACWLAILYRCHYHDRATARVLRRYLKQKRQKRLNP